MKLPPPRPAARLAPPALGPRRVGGFTLFEMALTLLALALAGYIAVGEVRKFQHRSQRDRFVTELRGLATVFETYRAQKGEWPASTNPEVRTPRGMEAVLANTHWLIGPPFGGSYDWMLAPARPAAADKDPAKLVEAKDREAINPADEKDAPRSPTPAGMIAVTAFSPNPPLSLTEEDLRYLDAKLDDGNLATGRFRAGFNRWPVYSITPSP